MEKECINCTGYEKCSQDKMLLFECMDNNYHRFEQKPITKSDYTLSKQTEATLKLLIKNSGLSKETIIKIAIQNLKEKLIARYKGGQNERTR